MNMLCLSGSLRQQSFSTAVLRSIEAHLAGRVETRNFDIRSLPHFDADIGHCAEAEDLKAAIEQADGVIIVTPEYNYSVPGVLKNAIDWASRPSYNSVFKQKPVFVASVSPGALGGVRAQAHLKYILNAMLAEVFVCQEVVITQAGQKFTDGELTDAPTQAFVTQSVDAFVVSLMPGSVAG